MDATRTLPERLTRSQLLHTPKRRTTVIDLHTRRRLLTRPATLDDITNLTHAWTHAATTAHDAASLLKRDLSRPFDRTLPIIERTL